MPNAAHPYGWGLPINVSTYGGQIDSLFWVIHVFMVLLFVGWGIFFVYCLVVFRSRPGHTAIHEPHAHSRVMTVLESLIVVFEVILLVGFAFPIWAAIRNNFPKPEDAVLIEVVAEQFAWNIRYPGKDGVFGKTAISLVTSDNPIGLDRADPAAKDDLVTINQLHVPVGKPVLIYLASKDVIHSFYVPVLRVKQDAVPGIRVPVWFEATQSGQYEIACAQLCGLGHYRMRGDISLDTPEVFAAWIQEQETALKEEQAGS